MPNGEDSQLPIRLKFRATMKPNIQNQQYVDHTDLVGKLGKKLFSAIEEEFAKQGICPPDDGSVFVNRDAILDMLDIVSCKNGDTDKAVEFIDSLPENVMIKVVQ